MLKKSLLFTLSMLLVTLPLTGYADVTINKLEVLDSANNTRTTFSSNEKVSFNVECFNNTDVPRIFFKFYVYDPTGMQVFSQEGNSAIGRPGLVGARLINIPLRFYTSPGNYTVKAEAVVNNIPVVFSQTSFSVYSPVIILSYPPNNAKEIVEQPIMFRWVGSGATKYRVTVDDDNSFYRYIWQSECYDTMITYPLNPTDQMQRLATGTIYWWKVEGMDNAGNIVANTSIPFNFTVKDTSGRDLAVMNLILEKGPTKDSSKISVEIKNQGGQAESDVQIDLYINGIQIIPSQRVGMINIGETKSVLFDCGVQQEGNIQAQATVNLMDDNPKNNTLSKMFVIETSIVFGKILGRVTDKTSQGQGITDARVTYNGPVNGMIVTGSGGQYKIENIPVGEYSLSAAHNDYNASNTLAVIIDASKIVHTNVDFTLDPKRMSWDDIWNTLRRKLSPSILGGLSGYKLVKIEAESEQVLQELIQKFKADKIKLVNTRVMNE